MSTKLPEAFRSLLWSSDFGSLDVQAHKDMIVRQIINYGTLAHWRWLRDTYGEKDMQDTIAHAPSGAFRPRARALASIVFHA